MFGPLLAVTAAVFLGLISAVILKEASASTELSLSFIILVIVVVVIVNGARFVIWGYIHRKHPISLSYPLGSIFFPLILVIGHFYYGDPISIPKIIGSIVIMIGVALLVIEEAGDDV